MLSQLVKGLVDRRPFGIASVTEFGAKGDGATDDTVAIQNAINTAGPGGVVFFPRGVYLISNTLLVSNDGMLLEGARGASIRQVSNQSALRVTGSRCIIRHLEIYSGGPTPGNGFYGIEVVGDYNRIENCYIHDIAYTAVFVSGSHNVLLGVTAQDCGWDAMSNFSSAEPYPRWNAAIDCHAIRCRRHGFSTDPGSEHIAFVRCYVEDVGHPSLVEGHSAYHFESSNYGVILDCTSRVTANHPLRSASGGGYIFGVRSENSRHVTVDGLTIVIDQGFTKIGTDRTDWVYADSTLSPVPELLLRRIKGVNPSAVPLTHYGGVPLLIQDSYFDGKFLLNEGYGSLKALVNTVVDGRDKTTSFWSVAYTSWAANGGTTIRNCVFRNLDYAISGGAIQLSIIENNQFFNCNTGIRLGADSSNYNSKSLENLIRYNAFVQCTTSVLVTDGAEAAQYNNITEHNVIS